MLNMQEIEFEKLAAMQPDLILAVMSGITKGDYGKLSAIAPTIAQAQGLRGLGRSPIGRTPSANRRGARPAGRGGDVDR